ncbi:hypothetical protein [Thalassotalea castellviae]|uniref:Glycosyl transferase family 2 n=1 Tax=Thalassotalea castellviae TaxID=3075612 RepID=A0ABU3A520_9GAMM|nr:hypothetical protein [Thalassotalea sp. W431]MDT0605274.1 hypothetical protein [Thalassotalea sp. W431]
MNNFAKYLTKYAEDEVSLLATFPQHKSFSHTLIIPAYKESPSFIDSFIRSSLVDQNVLLIIVINQPEYETDSYPQSALAQHGLSTGKVTWQSDNLTLVDMDNSNSAILVIDRFTQPIPNKQGVGLARKIGADVACALIEQKVIKSMWLHSSDADAQLPDNYFTSLMDNQSHTSVAACYNFIHSCDDKVIESANAIYEQALRYYVAGLSYAKSPYNYFTIGSVLVFRAQAYVTVRGFPKRSAGEDFYLLNKIAKLGDILWLKNSVLRLEARMSDRVPFGTGPAVKQIVELSEKGQSYHYYHPVVFERLKSLLHHFSSLHQNLDNLSVWYKTGSNDIEFALKTIGFDAFVDKQKGINEKQFNKQLLVWFDAFKTLKFIHALKDNYYPNIPIEEAISQANFVI